MIKEWTTWRRSLLVPDTDWFIRFPNFYLAGKGSKILSYQPSDWDPYGIPLQSTPEIVTHLEDVESVLNYVENSGSDFYGDYER